MNRLPISMQDVLAAQHRIRPHLVVTPLHHYPALDALVGADIRVMVKHDNHQPTGSFKVRNALSAMTALSPSERKRGVIAASRGNHGAGLAYAGHVLDAPVTICVPKKNNPDKNALIVGYGATLEEKGRDYDESLEHAEALVRKHRYTMVHSTNNAHVVAGAGTATLEMLSQCPDLDALVVSAGGGSQAVGAITVARALRPSLQVYAVGAERAPALHDSWHARTPKTSSSADTIADGLATRSTYELTFPALQEGLEDFVKVSEAELAAAVRMMLRTTHNLAEASGAAGLAGVIKLRSALAGKRVGIILSGGNIDMETLQRVVNAEV